ncbi:MAG: hypothetical protein ACRCZR_05315 [Cetobacterium sp.]
MKKILLVLIGSLLLFLLGCSSSEIPNNWYYPKKYVAKYTIKNTNNLKLKVEQILIDTKLNMTSSSDYTKMTEFPIGLKIKLKNTSSEVTEIIWSSSSINNSSIFGSGQKYIDAGRNTKPNSIISGNNIISESIYPSQSIYYDKNWKHRELNIPSEVILKIKQGSKEGFFVIDIKSYNVILMIDEMKKHYNVSTEEELPKEILEIVKWKPKY